ncbi:Zn-dependent oxidoreductase [Halovenus sp. WSH3]|uniref:Zn-dependent oxidoreductase n=1 Tax=Halovenus carboxidivorans TaxID=2692199 RepID=A0A6B0T2I6_9EURY|nr:Zn-dependent oxidoreductase [Halovenus carboxidivorans]MXR52185.1 Zn-dependent oxidoreductase [Halovenus carboxidivorans]
MSENDHEQTVTCTITPEQAAERPAAVLATLADRYVSSTEHEDGYTHVFQGTQETVEALATFVANEQRCCGFASYELAIEPPYEQTAFRVSGPEGTKELLGTGFLTALGVEPEE